MKKSASGVFATCFVLLILAVGQEGLAELRAGAAKVEITPAIGCGMAGSSEPDTKALKGVHDPLFARVLVLDDGGTKLAVVSIEVGAGERLVNRALINLYYQAKMISP